jgi:hypothetical protein
MPRPGTKQGSSLPAEPFQDTDTPDLAHVFFVGLHAYGAVAEIALEPHRVRTHRGSSLRPDGQDSCPLADDAYGANVAAAPEHRGDPNNVTRLWCVDHHSAADVDAHVVVITEEEDKVTGS